MENKGKLILTKIKFTLSDPRYLRRSSLNLCITQCRSFSLLNSRKDIGLTVNTRTSMYMEIGLHWDMMANEHIRVGSNLYVKVKSF